MWFVGSQCHCRYDYIDHELLTDVLLTAQPQNGQL